MTLCNYCGKEICKGYLSDDYYLICEECKRKQRKEDELDKKYCEEGIFWASFHENSRRKCCEN